MDTESTGVSFIMSLLRLFPSRNLGSWKGSQQALGNPLLFIPYLLSQVTTLVEDKNSWVGQGNTEQLRFRKRNMPRGLVWEQAGMGIQSLACGGGDQAAPTEAGGWE